MQVKLTNYRLNDYYRIKDHKIKLGIHVCPANGCTKIGTIVEVGPMEAHSYHNHEEPEWVKIRWSTGSKKGKIEQKEPDSLVNADLYLAAIHQEYSRVTDMMEEAKGLD
jgi:hypothetical protein